MQEVQNPGPVLYLALNLQINAMQYVYAISICVFTYVNASLTQINIESTTSGLKGIKHRSKVKWIVAQLAVLFAK